MNEIIVALGPAEGALSIEERILILYLAITDDALAKAPGIFFNTSLINDILSPLHLIAIGRDIPFDATVPKFIAIMTLIKITKKVLIIIL